MLQLTRSVPDGLVLLLLARLLKDVNGFLGAAHVAALGNELGAGLDERLGLVVRNLVLGRRGKGNVDISAVLPWTGTLDPLELASVLGAVGELRELLALKLKVGDDVDELGVDTLVVGGNQGTLAVGEGDDGTAKLDNLERSVLGNVSRTRESDALAGEGLLAARGVLDHVLDILSENFISHMLRWLALQDLRRRDRNRWPRA